MVIIGLARSGTTMLQRMMKNDPQLMSTMLWEMMASPVPPGRPDNFRDTDRYKKTVQYFSEYDEIHWRRLKTVNTNSAKRDISPSANGMVYHIGVCASVRNIPGLSH